MDLWVDARHVTELPSPVQARRWPPEDTPPAPSVLSLAEYYPWIVGLRTKIGNAQNLQNLLQSPQTISREQLEE
jgi:hypothetical protein